MRIDACNLCRSVCFRLIKQFMNSLKVAKQARATCCCTNSTFWPTTSFTCRLARSQPCLTNCFNSGIRCCHQPWSKGKDSGPLLIAHRLWSRLTDGQIRPPFVSTRICFRAFRADFLYRWLLVESKQVVLKPYTMHKELSCNRIFILRSRVSAIRTQSQLAYYWP